jgi:hypothetical protein
MRNTILLLFLIISFHALGQQNFYYNESGSEPETIYDEKGKAIIKQAYHAYNINRNIEETISILSLLSDYKYYPASYYYLIGKCYYDKKVLSYAKSYWKKGSKKANCIECYELYLAVKNKKSVLPVIKKHQAKWEAENKP